MNHKALSHSSLICSKQRENCLGKKSINRALRHGLNPNKSYIKLAKLLRRQSSQKQPLTLRDTDIKLLGPQLLMAKILQRPKPRINGTMNSENPESRTGTCLWSLGKGPCTLPRFQMLWTSNYYVSFISHLQLSYHFLTIIYWVWSWVGGGKTGVFNFQISKLR